MVEGNLPVPLKQTHSFRRSFFVVVGIVAAVIGMQCPTANADDCERFADLRNVAGPPRPHEKTAISSNAQKITKTLNGIVFDSNYDNGSLQNVVTGTGTDVYTCTIFVEDSNEGLGTRTYNFRFKMTGVAGRTVTLNISHPENPRPFVSFDGVTFRRTTSTEAPSTTRLVITCGAAQNFCEVAFYDPLGYAEIHRRVNLLATNANATTQVIGQSFQGRDMWMVTVTDPSVADTGKRRVWFHARAHAGEVTASWVMLGFLQQVTENSNLGQRLRRNCIFNIVPTENVDGVYLGLTRWSAQGLDPERQWGQSSPIAEVANLKAKVNVFMAGANPIEVALNLHSTVNNYADSFFFKHVQPSVTANFETIEQNYINAANNATTFFDNLAPQTSQLDPTIFIESYFWNNWHESVMAMTMEGHYYFRTASSTYNTGADYMEVGKGLAGGLVSYFNLPPLSGIEGWQEFD
jgi:hypothetical protein